MRRSPTDSQTTSDAGAISPRRRLAAGASLALALLVVALAAGSSRAQGPEPPAGSSVGPADVSLPAFDPGSLEPAVAEQLAALRAHVDSVIAAGPPAPVAAEAVGELGRHYHAYELVEPAEQCFRTAASLAPRDFRWRYHLAYLLQRTGRLEEAAASYERALGIVPEVPPALIRLGEVYQALDRPQAAIDVLARALELDPAASAAQARLGEVFLAERRYREAAERLEAALSMEPEANLLYYPLALAYRGLGEEDKARQLMARRGKVGVRAADPLIDGMAGLTTGERVHLLRGRSAFGAGRFEEAVEEFRSAVEVNPESISALVNLGTALAQSGEFEAAVTTYRRAIELGSGNATARFNLGTLLARLGRLEEARDELRGALLYAPGDAAAHFELGRVLSRLERHDESLVHFSQAVDKAPAAAEARLAQVQALIALDRWAEALEQLEEARRVLPSSLPVGYALSRFLAACPRPDLRDGARALEIARQIHDAEPSRSRAELVAEALAEAGDCAAAAEWQRQVLGAAGAETPEADLRRIRTRLAHYEGGPPCRPPADPPAQ